MTTAQVSAQPVFARAIDNKHFDLIRDIYLSDDIAYGETAVLMMLFSSVASHEHLEGNGDSEICRIEETYENKLQKLGWKKRFAMDQASHDACNEEIEAWQLENCEKLVPLVDREKLVLAVQGANLRYFKWCNEIWGLYDPTFLSNSTLTENLKLTKKQQKQLSDEHKRISSIQEKLWEDFAPAYDELAKQALDDINDVLDAEQRTQFKDLIGTPVNWARMTVDAKRFGYEFNSANPNSSLESDNRSLEPTNPGDDLDKLPKIELFLFTLLKTKFLRSELDLSGDQEKTMVATLKAYRKHRVIDESETVDRFESLVNSKSTYPKEIAKILVRHQEDVLRQVELQFRTGAYLSSFGILHPLMAEKLELTKRQQTAIKKVSKRFEAELAAFADEVKLQFADLMRAEYLKTMTILNDDQLKRYTILTGLDTSNIQTK